MKECGCRKVIIDDSNAIKVELDSGDKYNIYDGDDNIDMNDPHFEESDDNDDDDAEKEDKDEKINERQQQKRPKRNQPKREHKKFRKQLDDDNDDIMDDEEEEDKKEEEKKEKNEEEEQENEEEVQENKEEVQENKEEVQENKEEVQENKEEVQENEEEEQENKEEEIEQIPKNIIDMGKDLHILLQNINKIPTPPPSNNPQHSTNEYRSILVTHLSNIDSVDEFSNCREIFIPVESYSSIPIELSNVNKPSSASSILPSPSQKHSATSSLSQKSWLNVILNEEKHVESSYDPMILDNEIPVERGEVDWDNVDPVTLLELSDEERTKKQEEACLFITNRIINIYESTIEDQIKTEVLRRFQFKKLILLLEYYEKLEAYCNLNLKRAKGDTIKAQASKMIIKSSKPSEDQPPRIKVNELTVMTGQALRMRRLLNVASKNYNIFYAFPDLQPQFFLPKKLSVVNYERWLKLVETGELPSVEKGKQLHNEYKERIKKIRMEKFKF